ncbi:formyltransferase family protein [Candidatus Pelagibacter sp.]|nr:formyltransferase family protein [Candidatus Pelagibacter sp.]
MSLKKKIRVTFLFDNSNLWLKKHITNYKFNLNKKLILKFSSNKNKVLNQDIVFPIGYTKILPNTFLHKNKNIICIHASKLPKDKGAAPVQNQILRNKKKIFISLFKATSKIDSGPIFLQDYFYLNGTELYEEIRYKQAKAVIKIMIEYLKKFPGISPIKYNKKSTYNKKRTPKDSELDINKTIKDQFNHLRINDNIKFPSFFIYKKTKYFLKIYKKK